MSETGNLSEQSYVGVVNEVIPFINETNFPNMNDREILSYYINNVFSGDPELRVYSFESLSEQVDMDKLVDLQKEFSRSLPEKERVKLIERIPKGSKVEFSLQTYSNGSSVVDAEFWRKAYMSDGVTFLDHNKVDDIPNDLESLQEAAKLTRQEQLNVVQELYPELPVIINTIKATIQAEPIQRYGGVRIITDDGEMMSIKPGDVKEFAITGIDKEEAKRRPWEVYPDRAVMVLEPNTKTWVEGTMDDIVLGDELRVKLTNPLRISTILNVDKVTDSLVVNIGLPSEYKTGKTPEIGSDSFENQPWLHESIKLEFETTRTSIENMAPEIFVRGNLIQMNGEIYEVGKVSSQGFAQVKNINLSPSGDSDIVRWNEMDNLPALLTDEGLSQEIIEMGKRIKGARIRISTRQLGFKSDEENVIVSIKGIFNIDGSPQVLLEALPVWLSIKANIPPFIYKPVALNEFSRWQTEGDMEISNINITRELKEKFPNRMNDIIKYLEDDGSVSCDIKMKDGRTTSCSVSLASLPFGVWIVFNAGDKPQLYSLDEIEDIVAYDWQSKHF